MVIEVKRIQGSWEYAVPGFGRAHIKWATLGKNKGKLFLISEDYKKVAEINVIKQYKVKVPFGKEVNVAEKIEIVRENLDYNEVFFEVARKTKFAIEDGEIYEGFTYNQYWNGWDMPMFEKDVTEKILKELTDSSSDWKVNYNSETDTFSFKYGDDEEWEKEEGHDILGDDGKIHHVYDIGAGSWIWSENEEREEEDED